MFYLNWFIFKFFIIVGIIVLSNYDWVGEDVKYWVYWYFVMMGWKKFYIVYIFEFNCNSNIILLKLLIFYMDLFKKLIFI